MSRPPAHLIIVCCHAIWTGSGVHSVLESDWLLAPFQAGESSTYIKHIRAGLNQLSSFPDSILVFSGGPTRPETTLSESESYVQFAQIHSFFDEIPQSLSSRILLESRALDSFQNVLFSMTLFFAYTNTWPEKTTIVSHEFKRKRFLDLHCKALRLRPQSVQFVGIDPPYMDPGNAEWDKKRACSVRKGEAERGWAIWERDPLGTSAEARRKRAGRNFWGVGQGLFAEGTDEEIKRKAKLNMIILEDGHEVLNAELQPWETAG